MQTGYHNHETEFAILDNQLIYDELMKRFDAEPGQNAVPDRSDQSWI